MVRKWASYGLFASVLAILAVFSLFVSFGERGRVESTTAYRQAPRTAGLTTYFLHTECITHARDVNPGFFADGKTLEKAFIVRHNLGSGNFFPVEGGLEMTKVTPEMTGWEFGWESDRFVLETDQVDNEWGFALVNSANEVFYEIGGGPEAPLWGQTCPDLVVFANENSEFHNRLVPREANPQRHEYIFGSCETRCPYVPIDQWPQEKIDRESALLKASPPNTLGSSFTMYGTAGTGVCTANLLAGEDIMFHLNPRDWRQGSALVMDAWYKSRGLTYGRPEYFRSLPYKFGPTGDRSSTFKWRVKFTYKVGYFDIVFCTDWYDDDTCEPYTTYNYGNGDDGYKYITRLQVFDKASGPDKLQDKQQIKPADCFFYATKAGVTADPYWGAPREG